ncbi:MAG: ZmpA/ZmpB/ZmpC family metallo-endopeptidase-related protein, partial [Candidatus Pacearchaeota archaeon]
RDNIELASLCSISSNDLVLDSEEGYTCFNYSNSSFIFRIKKGKEEINYTGMKIVFLYKNKSSNFTRIFINFEDKNTFKIFKVENIPNKDSLSEVEIIPIINIGKREKECEAFQKIKIESKIFCSNYSFSSKEETLEIDVTPPSIQFVSSTEQSGVFRARNWIYVNVSVSDANYKNTTIYLYNSTSLINTSNLNSTNFTLLSDGTYFYNATACDYANNCNSTETRSITLDTSAPRWSNNKTNLTNETPLGSYVYFNITLIEENPSHYIFSWYNGTQWINDSAKSYTNGEEIQIIKQINVDVGYINWTFYVNDSLGNTNRTPIFSVNLGTSFCFANGMFGRGTTQSPCIITNCIQLQSMNKNLSASYMLGKDIDCSETRNWNNRAGFLPVGNETNPFNGSLSGSKNKYKIFNLFINRTSSDIGLFGRIKNGKVENISLVGIEYYGKKYLGGIAGYTFNTTISEVFISGVLQNIDSMEYVGGVVGYSDSSFISNLDSDINITSKGNYVGGVVGSSDKSSIKDGRNITVFINAEKEGNGGLVGYSKNDIISNFTLYVNLISKGNDVGGAIGKFHNGDLSFVLVIGEINSSKDNVGGIAGYSYGARINNSIYIIKSFLKGNNSVGGIIGYGNNAYLTNVSIEFNEDNYYIEGNFYVGGIAGKLANSGRIINSSISKMVKIKGNNSVGGMIGNSSKCSIFNTHVLVNVSGKDMVGGGFGFLEYANSINSSSSIGIVSGRNFIGGFGGFADGKDSRIFIHNSYSRANVSGSSYVGGFLGSSYNITILNSYSTGNVSGSSYVGGFIGNFSLGSISNSFFDNQTSGVLTPCGVGNCPSGIQGKTTAQMKNISTYRNAGWDIKEYDFEDLNVNEGYPFLGSEIKNSSYIWFISTNI